MAFDKLVDSAALEANLKTVADAIREKAGTSDALAFPVGFAEAIAAIEAGGGGKVAQGSITPATTTQFQGTVAATTAIAEHNLGEIPNLYVVYGAGADPTLTDNRYFKGLCLYCHDINDTTRYFGMLIAQATSAQTEFYNYASQNGGYVVSGNKSGTSCLIKGASTTRVEFAPWYTTNKLFWQAGVDYNWIVAVVK